MWDIIKQTELEHKELLRIKELEYKELLRIKDNDIKILKGHLKLLIKQRNELKIELKKWTDNQDGRKSTLTEEQKNKIVEFKKISVSNRKIAKKINVSEGTIRNFLKKNSIYEIN